MAVLTFATIQTLYVIRSNNNIDVYEEIYVFY